MYRFQQETDAVTGWRLVHGFSQLMTSNWITYGVAEVTCNFEYSEITLLEALKIVRNVTRGVHMQMANMARLQLRTIGHHSCPVV